MFIVIAFCAEFIPIQTQFTPEVWHNTHGNLDLHRVIVFTYPQLVELDSPESLTSGLAPLVEKLKGKHRVRDFTEGGEDDNLDLPRADGNAYLIDVLHQLSWLVEHRPAFIPAYRDEARPDVERLRVVSQTLARQTLAGNRHTRGPIADSRSQRRGCRPAAAHHQLARPDQGASGDVVISHG